MLSVTQCWAACWSRIWVSSLLSTSCNAQYKGQQHYILKLLLLEL